MAENVKLLLDNLHECLNVGAVEALPVILDLQSSVRGCSEHELGDLHRICTDVAFHTFLNFWIH